MDANTLDYQFWTGFYDGDDCVAWASNKAYLDMNRTMTFRESTDGLKESEKSSIIEERMSWRDEGTEVIQQRLSILNGDFDTWHKETCEKIRNVYKPKDNSPSILVERKGKQRTKKATELTLGQAQKWLNMTLKYLWLLNNLGMIEDESLSNTIKTHKASFHVPLDSYILRYVGRQCRQRRNNDFPADNGLSKEYTDIKEEWSKITDYDTYKAYQSHIRNDNRLKSKYSSPLEWELEHWHKALQYYDDKIPRRTKQQSKTEFVIVNGEVKAYYGKSRDIVIPDGVKKIGKGFLQDTGIVSVTIPASVSYIGKGAFTACGLTSIHVNPGNRVFHSAGNCLIRNSTKSLILGCNNSVIPADGTVTSIGDNAFMFCTELKSVNIPDSVTSIGDHAFCSCFHLASVTIGNSVVEIGNYAFNSCFALESIVLPDSVTTIGPWAFGDCRSLTSIVIPDSVTSLGNGALSDCRCLKEVKIPRSVTSLCDCVLSNCPSLTSIDIPDSVTSIGNEALHSCTGLTDLIIPASVTTIDLAAFNGCTGLKSISIPNSVQTILAAAFEDCTSLTSVTIPDSMTYMCYKLFAGCTSLTNVIIGNGVSQVDERTFMGCTSLTSLTIPASVVSIDEYAFADCLMDQITVHCVAHSYADRFFRRKNVKVEYDI